MRDNILTWLIFASLLALLLFETLILWPVYK